MNGISWTNKKAKGLSESTSRSLRAGSAVERVETVVETGVETENGTLLTIMSSDRVKNVNYADGNAEIGRQQN